MRKLRISEAIGYCSDFTETVGMGGAWVGSRRWHFSQAPEGPACGWSSGWGSGTVFHAAHLG